MTHYKAQELGLERFKFIWETRAVTVAGITHLVKTKVYEDSFHPFEEWDGIEVRDPNGKVPGRMFRKKES